MASFQIPKNEKLSPAESDVEKRFAALVCENLEQLIAEYSKRFGRVIDVDRARELCPDYAASDTARTKWSVATYNPARALADEVYRREIGKPAGPQGCRILFTSGGAGSGKTTAIEALLADSSNAANYFDILVDGTLSDFDAARSKIRQALALGHSVTIIHVNREFLETVRMVVKRAVEMGRVVALEDIAVTRFRSQETLFKLQSEFSGKINIRVLENLTNASPSEIGLDYLGKKRAKSIDELREQAQTLFAHEFGGLKTEHPEIFKAFLQKGSRR